MKDRSPGIPYHSLDEEQIQAALPLDNRWWALPDITTDELPKPWAFNYEEGDAHILSGPSWIDEYGSLFKLSGFDAHGRAHHKGDYFWSIDVLGSDFRTDSVLLTVDVDGNFRVFHHYQDEGSHHEHSYRHVRYFKDLHMAALSMSMLFLFLSSRNQAVSVHMYNESETHYDI